MFCEVNAQLVQKNVFRMSHLATKEFPWEKQQQ